MFKIDICSGNQTLAANFQTFKPNKFKVQSCFCQYTITNLVCDSQYKVNIYPKTFAIFSQSLEPLM